MDVADRFKELDRLLSIAADQASVAEWAWDKGRADEAEQKQLDAEAASSERELVEATQRLRAEGPEVVKEWATRHVQSLEKLLKQKLTDGQREHIGDLIHEWQAAASGARDAVTVCDCHYYRSYSDGRAGITLLSLL